MSWRNRYEFGKRSGQGRLDADTTLCLKSFQCSVMPRSLPNWKAFQRLRMKTIQSGIGRSIGALQLKFIWCYQIFPRRDAYGRRSACSLSALATAIRARSCEDLGIGWKQSSRLIGISWRTSVLIWRNRRVREPGYGRWTSSQFLKIPEPNHCLNAQLEPNHPGSLMQPH